MKNFAHRGYREKYPENTMLAFKKAIENNADGIEFDVHLTKDEEVVIIHDETLNRTTNAEGHVKDFTLKELKKLNAGYYLNEFGFQEIPSLEEYFEYIKNLDIITNIELKTGVIWYKGIEKKVYDLICKYNMNKKVIVSSFNHKSVMEMKKIDSTVKCGFLVDDWLLDPSDYLKKYGIECYHPPIYSLDKDYVKKLHEEGIEVNAWHSKEEFDIKNAIDMELDVLISDYTKKVDDIICNSK